MTEVAADLDDIPAVLSPRPGDLVRVQLISTAPGARMRFHVGQLRQGDVSWLTCIWLGAFTGWVELLGPEGHISVSFQNLTVSRILSRFDDCEDPDGLPTNNSQARKPGWRIS